MVAAEKPLSTPPFSQGFLMSDFAAARLMMVDGQVRTHEVSDLRLIAAMQEIPRERFVPAPLAPIAYLDLDLAVSDAPPRYLLKPMVLAKLIQAAKVAPTDRVLDIACGTGYSSAILARLGESVVGLDDNAALMQLSGDYFRGTPNVKFVIGALAEGYPAAAPYDVILINGACQTIPQRLLSQLGDQGRLVCMRGAGATGTGVLWQRSGDAFGERALFDAAAPALPDFAKPPAFAF
jgi:protein-L-isoaspartate(D-aspartate) O-methyltransferase